MKGGEEGGIGSEGEEIEVGGTGGERTTLEGSEFGKEQRVERGEV